VPGNFLPATLDRAAAVTVQDACATAHQRLRRITCTILALALFQAVSLATIQQTFACCIMVSNPFLL